MRRLGVLLGTVVVSAFIVTGCGGGSSPSSGDSSFKFDPSQSGEPAHWADVWCEVDGSMTRDAVINLMGEPSEEFDASEGEPQSSWNTGSFSYTVFYDSSGHVEQAYVNKLELPPAEAPFTCEEVRFF